MVGYLGYREPLRSQNYKITKAFRIFKNLCNSGESVPFYLEKYTRIKQNSKAQGMVGGPGQSVSPLAFKGCWHPMTIKETNQFSPGLVLLGWFQIYLIL